MNALDAEPKVSLLHRNDRDFTPRYLDLAHKLLLDIANRGLKPGELLGTETELIARHGLSRSTVRQALAVLNETDTCRASAPGAHLSET